MSSIGGSVRAAKVKISPAWSPWIAPGRIGFMKTQRLQDCLRLARCKDCVGNSGIQFPSSPARELPAIAAGQTAPPVHRSASAATKSLLSDHPRQSFVRLVSFQLRFGSPPKQASERRLIRSFFPGVPHMPSFAGSALSHLTLPCVPAALSRRTERYDGKRNLHFQHAA